MSAVRTRLWLNLALAGVVAALVLVAVFEPGKAPPPEPEKISTLDVDAVERIRIERRGAETLAFAREDGQWWLVEPRRIPANAYRVEAILELPRTPSAARFDPATVDLAAFGLVEPEVRVHYGERVFALGGVDALHQRRYVLHEGALHLATNDLRFRMLGAWPEFANPRLLRDGQKIEAVTTPAYALDRDADGHWRLRPERAGLSADDLQTLAEEWRHATALELRAATGKEQGQPITLRITGELATRTLLILERSPQMRIADPALGLIYEFAEGTGKRLLDPPVPKPEPKPVPAAAEPAR